MKGTPVKRAQDFSHFVRKCHPSEGAFQDFLPELLATDGSWIRRFVADPHQFIFQEFRAPVIADTIRSHINTERDPGSALMGYSAFERMASVAIVHSADDYEPGWLATPWKSRFGEPALPALSSFVEKAPAMGLVARGRQTQTSRTRLLEIELDQCGADDQRIGASFFHLLPYIDGLDLWGTYRTKSGYRDVRLSPRRRRDSAARRGGLRRVEKAFPLDTVLFDRLVERDSFRVWLEVKFSVELVCLPEEWRRWWFEVTI